MGSVSIVTKTINSRIERMDRMVFGQSHALNESSRRCDDRHTRAAGGELLTLDQGPRFTMSPRPESKRSSHGIHRYWRIGQTRRGADRHRALLRTQRAARA